MRKKSKMSTGKAAHYSSMPSSASAVSDGSPRSASPVSAVGSPPKPPRRQNLHVAVSASAAAADTSLGIAGTAIGIATRSSSSTAASVPAYGYDNGGGSTASLPLESFSGLALGKKRMAASPKQGQPLAFSYNTGSPRGMRGGGGYFGGPDMHPPPITSAAAAIHGRLSGAATAGGGVDGGDTVPYDMDVFLEASPRDPLLHWWSDPQDAFPAGAVSGGDGAAGGGGNGAHGGTDLSDFDLFHPSFP